MSAQQILAYLIKMIRQVISSVLFFLPTSPQQQPPRSGSINSSSIYTIILPTPPILHAYLSFSPHPHLTQHRPSLSSSSFQNIFIVGDIHGCHVEFLDLLQKAQDINQRPFDAILSVGDLCNKGPSSLDVIREFRQNEHYFTVRGNHDDGALKAAVSGVKRRLQKKKYDWVSSLEQEDVTYLSELPYSITIPGTSRDIVVVHAGLIPNVPLEHQTIQTMVTIRDIGMKRDDDDGTTQLVDARKYKTADVHPWASLWNDETKQVIFGHDAKRGVQQWKYAIGLDSGACYGKELTGIILPEGRLVSVRAREVYCPIDEK